MVTVYVKTEGQDLAMNIIGSMAARGENTQPLMGIVGHIILGSVSRNFESQGRPKWKPISSFTQDIYSGRLLERLEATAGFQKLKREKTRVAKRTSFLAKKGGRMILQGEGDLKKSVVVGKITRNSVEIGSSLPYARIHQLGGTIEPKKSYLFVPISGGFIRLKKVEIPARPYLLLQNEDETAIVKATKAYLEQSVQRAKGIRWEAANDIS
ncbi:MAG TPA: phage virion morphogenesis protein [Syntrophomonadaceae bacterium]|nr:phage virion morphogenesis protein [Syntrophomonadaceae bacterium]